MGVHRCLGTIEPVHDFLAEATEGETTHKVNALTTMTSTAQENEGTAIQQEENYTHPPEDELDEKYRFSVDNMPPHLQQLVEDSVANLTVMQKKTVTVLLFHFSDIFAKDETDIGKTHLITHDVDTGDAKPVAQSVRRQSPEEYDAMVKIVDNLYKCGIIKPSRSQ